MTTCPRCGERAARPGGNAVEVLACLACGHVEYGGTGRSAALPRVAEKRRYRPRKPKWGERLPSDTRAAWGSGPMSRTRRSERLEPLAMAPDAVTQGD